MPIQQLRIGLIVPSSNTVMEPDFHRYFQDSAIVSTTRIFLENVTREAEVQMLQEELPGALERIRTTAPNVVVFGCTSAGALGTLSHDECIAEMAEVKTAARTVTVLQAVLMQLSVIRPRKLAVLTPYIDDLTNGIVRCLTEANHTPIKAAGMGIEANLDIGRVVPAEIVDFVEQQISGIDPDCLFLSCTNWRALDVIEPLQKKLSIPVISSNQAAIQAVQQLSGSVARRPEK